MSKSNIKLQCSYCGEAFAKTVIKRHLEKCEVGEKRNEPGKSNYYWIQVRGYKDYCMYLDVAADAYLQDIDEFLRSNWLECCGHLSMFRIGDTLYDSDSSSSVMLGDFGVEGKSMKVKLTSVLSVGMEFIHEYDFGSTTVLKLKVLSLKKAAKRKQKIVLMARNLPPAFECVVCGKAAEQVCCECIYEEDAYFCDDCGKNHECGEDMMLPIVNSPRMGVCAYCG